MTNAKAEAFNQWKHPKTSENDYRTPEFIINWLKAKHGPAMYDCAFNEDHSNALGRPFDLWGEKTPAVGHWLFINPPWDTPTVRKFVERARYWADRGWIVCFLLPNKLTEVTWMEHINQEFNHLIFLGGRLDFSGPHSVKKGTSRWGTFVGIMDQTEQTEFSSERIKRLKAVFSND